MAKKNTKVQTDKIMLSNGVTLLVQEEHSTPIISMAAYFRGGSGSETSENTGISPLMQRLMMKGAGDMDADTVADELEYRGISMYPFYGIDTAGLKMQTLSRHFDKGLDIFSRVIQQPVFPQDEFDKERENLIEDIKKKKDSVLGYTLDLCKQLVFEGHPYGLPSLGTIETVESLTREQVLEQHKLIYCPDRMVVALVGDIKAEEAREKMEKYFVSFENCSTLPEVEEIAGTIKNVKEKTENSEKQQVAICVGFHAPTVVNEDFYTFEVLNQVLSGMGSRLFIELRDKMGLAYAVNSRFNSFLKGGIFQAYILTGFKQKERARLAILEEVDRLRTRLVSYDELVRAKRYHLGLFDIGLQKKISIASKLAFYELSGLGHEFVEGYSERIKRITRQKVKRAAEKYLKPQCYAVSILTPATFPKSLR